MKAVGHLEVDGYAEVILNLLAKEDATVPALWPLGVVNGLAGAERPTFT